MKLSSAFAANALGAFLLLSANHPVVAQEEDAATESPYTEEQAACFALQMTSCGACVNAGCLWCPGHATCAPFAFPYGQECAEEGDWEATCDVDEESDNLFSDPLYDAQKWVFDILNVLPAWEQGYTGEGILIQAADSGTDLNHTEFAGRVDWNASCEQWMPLVLESPHDHGTDVASIAAASADNDECAVGVAPHATIAACNVFVTGPIHAFTKAIESNTDISTNSWNNDACAETDLGDLAADLVPPEEIPALVANNLVQEDTAPEEICPLPFNTTEFLITDETATLCTLLTIQHCQADYETTPQLCDLYLSQYSKCTYNTLTEEQDAVLERAVTEGRYGNGLIMTFAAGNEFTRGETINMEAWLNSRYTISVGAVGKDGLHSSYSTTGSAALFISGPGGDFEFQTNHITANLIGGGCHDASVGTSYATPAIAGAIAVVLQANPDLGWRDVQGILASTAHKMDEENPSWTTNAAGYHHSPFYGFGVMDTSAAVDAAMEWTNWGPELSAMSETEEVNIPIGADADSPAVSTLTLEADDFITESVVVHLLIDHVSRGDLEIHLHSPEGTTAALLPGHRDENTYGPQALELMSLLSWGEDPSGEWTLTVVDVSPGNVAACADMDYIQDAEGLSKLGPITCKTAEELCDDGMLNETTVADFLTQAVDNSTELVDDLTGVPIAEACCDCGGGIPLGADEMNALVSWKLVAYGHAENEVDVEINRNGDGSFP